MSEDDKIVGVETECPMCHHNLDYWFRHGKELIAEFLEDLSHIKVPTRDPREFEKSLVFKLIEKWEGRKK